MEEVNASYLLAGENLALGQQTAAEVVQDWMDSEGHRANIMNANFTRIGIATVQSSGNYSGYAWAQMFTD